jgi:uncharacterized membrane protein YccC
MTWQLAQTWLVRHHIELGLSLRMTVAGLLSFALAHLFAVSQTYWAVLTAVIVTQASIGGSLKATLDRLVSTLGGAGWGAAVTLAIPHSGVLSTELALVAALIPLSLVVAFRPSYRVAPVTAAIVLLGHLGSESVLDAAFDRVFEIALGSAVALAVALAVSSARAHTALYAAAGDALAPMAEEIALLLAGVATPRDPAAVLALNDRIRAAIERAATTSDEAARERRSYLSDAPDPEPLVRNLRRLSHDLVMIARALAMPLPEPLRDQLSEPVMMLGAGLAARMIAIRDALAARDAPPADPSATPFAAFSEAMGAVRREGLTRALPDADVERVFGLLFGIDELRRNLDELAARVAELARA